MHKYFFTGLLASVWLVAAAAQPDSLQPVLSLPVAARFATADALGQIYIVNARNEVVKYARDGRRMNHYSQNRLGSAAGIDATNPLKILVWYADFRTMQFLDRSLTALGGDLNLIEAGFPEVRAVASARDGNLWIYEETTFKLYKINSIGTVLFESQALNQLFPQPLHPTALRDDGQQVFMTDPAVGILAFDIYAQYLRTLERPGVTDLWADGRELWYWQSNQLYREDAVTFVQRPVAAPPVGPGYWGAGVWITVGEEVGVYKGL